MQQNVFSVYDSKIEAFLQPFFMPTRAAAIRALTDTLGEPGHMFAKHPEDYTLFYLGSFEDEKAVFDLEPTPQSLAVLIELINTEGEK